MKSKKKLIIGIIGMILLLSGITFALWPTAKIQRTTNVINTGCFATTFVEKTSAISLANAFPITDKEGKQLTPYIFTITNTCTTEARYAINLDIDDQTNINLANIKVVLNEEYPLALSDYITTNPTITNASRSYLLKTGTLSAATAKNATDGGQETIALRMWLSEDMTNSEVNELFAAKIVVTTIAEEIQKKLLATGDLSAANEEPVSYEYYSDGTLIIKGTGEATNPTPDYFFTYQIYQAYVANNDEFRNSLTEAEKAAIIPNNHIFMLPVITGSYKSLAIFLNTFNLFINEQPTNYTEYIAQLRKEAPNMSFTTINESFFSLAAKIHESFPGFKRVKVEEGITKIGTNLLSFLNSYSVTLPSTLTDIETGAFAFSQTSIDLSNCAQLTAIGREAFFISYLSEIGWPTTPNITTLDERAFVSSTIDEMILPNTITSFGNELFAYATINRLVIPTNSSLTTLPHRFLKRAKIGQIIIPENITKIYQDAFDELNTTVQIKFIGPEREIVDEYNRPFDLSSYQVTWNYSA